MEIPKAIRGLYHPHCHCKKKGVKLEKENDIKMVIPKGKIEWLFRDKLHKMHEYGYHGESEWKIIDTLIFAAANAFEQGNYKCNVHDQKGFKITIFATIKGINHRQGETFKIKAGYTIFPNGQLKCNTLWGRRKEMKCYDLVKVIKDKDNYAKNNVHAGDVGRISEAWIINNCFTVAFDTGNDEDFYNFCEIKIDDLELVEEGWGTDEILLDELPKKDPHWWCKVEDGFIMNLKGDKKNKIPYDYNS